MSCRQERLSVEITTENQVLLGLHLLGLERRGNTSNVRKLLLLHKLSEMLDGVHDRGAATDAYNKFTLDVLVHGLTCSL